MTRHTTIAETDLECWTEEEVALRLRIGTKTLRSRRSRGTDHPPYIQVDRRLVLYPKDLFNTWLSARPIIWEVRSAARAQ